MPELQRTEEALAELSTLIEGCAPLRAVSLAYVRYVVLRFGDNKLRAAKQLHIDRRSIQRWFSSKPSGAVPK